MIEGPPTFRLTQNTRRLLYSVIAKTSLASMSPHMPSLSPWVPNPFCSFSIYADMCAVREYNVAGQYDGMLS